MSTVVSDIRFITLQNSNFFKQKNNQVVSIKDLILTKANFITLCLFNRLAVAVTGNSDNGELDENSNTDYLDFGEEEKFYFYGVVQKSDNSSGNEVMVTVHQCTSVIKNEGGFTSHIKSTEEAAQQSAAGKEESDNKENQQAAPPMPFNSAGVIMANQNDHNYYETNCLTDNIE